MYSIAFGIPFLEFDVLWHAATSVAAILLTGEHPLPLCSVVNGPKGESANNFIVFVWEKLRRVKVWSITVRYE